MSKLALRDARKILGVTARTTEIEIKKRWRELAIEHHPDMGGNPIRFVQINEAYSTITGADRIDAIARDLEDIVFDDMWDEWFDDLSKEDQDAISKEIEQEKARDQ